MSTQVTINDIVPKSQFTATSLQTVFSTNWTANVASDVLVYARASGVDADDATQLVSSVNYTVTFVGASETVRVTFAVGRTTDDIITVVRDTPADRLNLYTNTNFTPSMLNEDIGILTLVDQQSQLAEQQTAPHYNFSETLNGASPYTADMILPKLGANQIWAKNNGDTAIIAYDVPASGGVAPKTATYLVQTATSELPNAQAMGALASGLVVNTTTTGVQLSRILTGTALQLDVANGSGIAGNPTLSIASNPTIPGTEYILLPSGTTAQRPVSPTDGMLRYNTTTQSLEVYEGTAWDALAGGIVDTVTGTASQINVDSTDPQNPVLSLSATIDTPGTFTIGTTVVLDSVIDDDTFATATATNIPTSESVKAYVDSFGPGTVTSVDGTANEIDIDLTDPAVPVVGLASNAILPGTGGVNLPAGTVAQRAGAAGTLRFNTDALVFEGTVDGAAWVTLDTHTAGDVDSIIGTADQIIASSPTGNVTLSLPQSIATTSSPTFAALTLTAPLTVADGGSGRASTTAYAVICGGTTSTGAEQSIASVGTAGQILTSNGAGALPTFQTPAAGVGGLLSFQIFTSGTAATYTRPAGITSILVECVGGGGGGGGISITTGQTSSGGGGGSGSYCRKYYSSAASTYTYTVGAGGTGGAAGANAGSSGSATTFDVMTAGGATGGGAGTSNVGVNVSNSAGIGNSSSGGDINCTGSSGNTGVATLVSSNGGNGGGSYFGGAASNVTTTGSQSVVGSNATNYGGGGGGAAGVNVTTNRAGGDGSAGVIIVWEFS